MFNFMNTQNIFIAAAIVAVYGLVYFCHRYPVTIAWVKETVKKLISRTMAFSGAVCFVVLCAMSRFADISRVLLNVLPTEFVESFREGFKVLFGTESVFAAMQSLCIFTSAVFGILACLNGVCVFKHYLGIVLSSIRVEKRAVMSRDVVAQDIAPSIVSLETTVRYNS